MFRERSGRGQLFTTDFLIAAAVVTLILGVSLHTSEVIFRAVIQHASYSSNSPQAIAQAIVDRPPFHNLTYYCFNWNNGTANCTTPSFKLSCANFVAARRLANCTNSNNSNLCLLEVKTCV